MFSLFIHYAWLTAQAIIFCSLLLPAVLYAAYCISKCIRKPLLESEEISEEKDYAIIVSVSGETCHLQALLQSLQQLTYSNYLVYVVMNQGSDDCIPFSWDKLTVLRPAKPFTEASRIHRYAIESFRRPHTHVLLLNSNSIADSEYLNELNVFFNQGYQAVQGFFTRNKYSTLADVFHTLAHTYNRFFYGEVSFALGSSTRLDISGSAFTVAVYKQCLRSINTGGASLSRALQYAMTVKGYEIAFAPKAILHNQLTMHMQPLLKQHTVNIQVWFRQFASHLRLCLQGINTLSISHFLSGILLLQLPVLTSIVSGIFCLLITMRTNSSSAIVWMICLAIFTCYFIIAMVRLRTTQQPRRLVSGRAYLMPGIYETGKDERYKITT